MMITRDNYQSFFLDYLESNLPDEQIDQFLDFLEQNPDLKDELHRFENIILPDEKILFAGKKKLYKSAASQDIDTENKLVAYFEGDLEKEEKITVETFLAGDPEWQKGYKLFAKTRLIPDFGIRFPNEKNLYRKPGYVVVLNWTARAAAIVIMIWGFNSLYQNKFQAEKQTSGQELAEISRKVVIPETKKALEKEIQDTKDQEKQKPGNTTNHNDANDFHRQREVNLQAPEPQILSVADRDFNPIAAISSRKAKLQSELPENQLASAPPVRVLKVNSSRNEMTIEEFLASRAKKVGHKGLLSAERFARLGLGVASELSGKRIGYKETNGKITSLDFESNLLAFSIPLRKQ